MKISSNLTVLLACAAVSATAATEERLNKHFTTQPGGTIVVDVDFGSIDVKTNGTGEVVIDVYRKIGRGSKSDEEAYLKDYPVTFTQDGNTVTVHARGKSGTSWSWTGRNQSEAKYVITVPSQFNAKLKTAGGSIGAADLTGEVKSQTSGGSLNFVRIHGPLNGATSGGSIAASDCEGNVTVQTSGGGITVKGGSGSLKGETSGGSVHVSRFTGATDVGTIGGGISLIEVNGKIRGSTSGGSVEASLTAPVKEAIDLSTSAGGITLKVPAESAFDLDAETSAGGVNCDLPIESSKKSFGRLKGKVNGGGAEVKLRTSAGSIRVGSTPKVQAEASR